MALEEYQRKRKFTKTPEPAGARRGGRKGKPRAAARFVVQHHRARREHYDFRLEMDGVLKSWAVPKGPSYDTRDKRLAVETEDHPLEYADFEGLIPQGQYGAGPVLLWDRGTWQPLADDPLQAYREGMIKFELEGEKLRGRWALIRMRDRSGKGERNWLLIKERDELATPQAEFDVTAQRRESVASQRTIDQIAADDSSTSAADAADVPSQLKKNPLLRKAGRGRIPASIEPTLATLTRKAPTGEQWIHEIKFDGYRMICHRNGKKVKFLSRRDNDWTPKLRALVPAIQKLPGKQLILDGEVVVLSPEGISSFQALQNALGDAAGQGMIYYVFDLLYFEGHDLRKLALDQRKELLTELLAHLDPNNSRVRYSDHILGEGPHVWRQACNMGVEGIISKRRDRPYRSGRSTDWLKSKCLQSKEFIIGGYTRPSGSRTGFGALLLGHYNDDEQLVYAGRVGTGFNERTLRDLHKRLKSLEIDDSPFHNLQRKKAGRDVHFVRPELVAEVEYGSWTNDGMLRHTAFRGLREDKEPEEITGEEQDMPTIAQQIEQNSEALAAELEKVRFTHPHRVMYPEAGFTKLALAAYYTAIADWILPHVADRPLTLVRCPQGLAHKCFYQKHAMSGLPDTVDRIPIEEEGGTEDYLMIRDLVGLLTLVQFSMLEIHTWGSRRDNIEKPDRLIFDLDPDPSVPWPRVVEAAFEMRDLLNRFKLKSFVKTTGGKGLHVVLPIRRTLDWTAAKQFCKNVADHVMQQSPQHYTTSASKAGRRGKIYIDYLRNGRGATAVAAYSTRARDGGTVSVPLDWKELHKLTGPAQFNIENVPRRLAKLKKDPWRGIDQINQTITKKIQQRVEA